MSSANTDSMLVWICVKFALPVWTKSFSDLNGFYGVCWDLCPFFSLRALVRFSSFLAKKPLTTWTRSFWRKGRRTWTHIYRWFRSGLCLFWILLAQVFWSRCAESWICLTVAIESWDGEGLSRAVALRLWLSGKQSVQQRQRGICTQGEKRHIQTACRKYALNNQWRSINPDIARNQSRHVFHQMNANQELYLSIFFF